MKLYRVQVAIAMPDKAEEGDVKLAVKETIETQLAEICDMWAIPIGIAVHNIVEIEHYPKILDWGVDDEGEDDWTRWQEEVEPILEKEINEAQ